MKRFPKNFIAKGQKGGTFPLPLRLDEVEILEVSRSVVFREALVFTFLLTAGEGAIRCTGACFLRLNMLLFKL